MLTGRIFSISLRASAVRWAWAIKPTIRWPLSYQEKTDVSVSRLNTKNVETKVAVNGAREVGIINLYADEGGLSSRQPGWRGELARSGLMDLQSDPSPE